MSYCPNHNTRTPVSTGKLHKDIQLFPSLRTFVLPRSLPRINHKINEAVNTSDPQPRKVVPTGEQVNIRGVIFDMQQLEPMSDSPPSPTRTAPSPPSVSDTSEDRPSEKAAGKQREKMGPPSKIKVPSIRTMVDSSEDPLSEKAMGEQSEESGLALGDSDKAKQKDDRDTLPSSRKQEYQQGSSPKSKRRGRKVLSVMGVIGEEAAGSESDDEGVQAGGLARWRGTQ